MNKKVSSESVVKDIRRKTRETYSSEEKNRILNCPIYGREVMASKPPLH